jgi:hypothetical protein
VEQQEVMFKLAWVMYDVARKMKKPRIEYMTIDD